MLYPNNSSPPTYFLPEDSASQVVFFPEVWPSGEVFFPEDWPSGDIFFPEDWPSKDVFFPEDSSSVFSPNTDITVGLANVTAPREIGNPTIVLPGRFDIAITSAINAAAAPGGAIGVAITSAFNAAAAPGGAIDVAITAAINAAAAPGGAIDVAITAAINAAAAPGGAIDVAITAAINAAAAPGGVIDVAISNRVNGAMMMLNNLMLFHTRNGRIRVQNRAAMSMVDNLGAPLIPIRKVCGGLGPVPANLALPAAPLPAALPVGLVLVGAIPLFFPATIGNAYGLTGPEIHYLTRFYNETFDIAIGDPIEICRAKFIAWMSM